ncbi:MAG: hypothetical protein ACXWBP_11875, partial [Limisphaerales bacterium]
MRSLAIAVTLVLLSSRVVMSQTNINYSKIWFEHAPKVPALNIPSDVKQWEQDRAKIRAQLWKLLGDLPPRSKVPNVKTISREDREDYILEKFEFDNGAGATV